MRPSVLLVSSVLLSAGLATPAAAQRRPAPARAAEATTPRRAMTWTDLMAFRTADTPVLSANGRTLALSAKPDRGDPEGLVHRTDAPSATPVRVPRGTAPAVTDDGRFVAFRTVPTLAAAERARRARRDAPANGLALVDVDAGRVVHTAAGVKAFALARGGAVLAYQSGTPDRDSTARRDSVGTRPAPDSLQRVAPAKKRTPGTRLAVRTLATGQETAIPFVTEFAFSEDGQRLAYAVAGRDSTSDALYVRTLATGETTRLHAAPSTVYRHLTWSRTGALAFIAAPTKRDGTLGRGALLSWAPGQSAARVRTASGAEPGWMVPAGNRVAWSRDGQRLFVGLRPDAPEPAPADTAWAGTDPEAILRDRTVDVWGGRDARIQPQQKKLWDEAQKRVWLAVVHPDGRFVRLDSADVMLAAVPDNPTTGLAVATERYAREVSWDGTYADLFAVDLATGRKTRLATRVRPGARLSPDGRTVLHFDGRHWTARDVPSGAVRNLTAPLGRVFADEDNDLPAEAGPYGFGGWVDGGRAALVYDRYDVWRLPVDGSRAVNLTGGDGRARRVAYRVVDTTRDRPAFAPNEPLLLTTEHEPTRRSGFAVARADASARPDSLVGGEARYRFVRQSDGAVPTTLFTRATYRDFPDLYAVRGLAADAWRRAPRLTDVNPQLRQFRWGSSELVHWTAEDGTRLDGVLLKPENFDPTRRYPTLVYFYERLSDTVFDFTPPTVSHRLAFPMYTGEDYLVFLPDVVYEVGRPGLSAVRSIVPGVQALVERGLADPARIGVHGHSWGAYQVAWLVTQTDVFAAASAGAPVSNMTSAYGGVRWETGMSRQFQYEKTQSRLGTTLWDGRDRYIENSPLFYADRVNTPLLLIHGDEDGAVPWEQSIEYYLALRRLGKDVTFLQYRGEGHHPLAYANKLDWAMRLKEFFDVHLKGQPAPAWLTEGTPYAGR